MAAETKVLDGQSQHLRQVAHRRLAAVVLPVGVGDETRGGVEGQVGRHRSQPRRVERQPALQPLQGVQEQHAGPAEQQHGHGIPLPIHLLFGSHAGQAIEEPLHRSQDAIQPDRLVLVDAGHVPAQGLDQDQQQDKVQADLYETVGGHQKISGLSRATTR